MKGWLVNDRLTCIPGTKTLWHDLLEWIPGLEDPIKGYVPFHVMSGYIKEKVRIKGKPDFIVRNCTFFPPLDIETKTVSILQDIYSGTQKQNQIEVANASDLVIYNSEFTRSFYKEEVRTNSQVIPLGIDFNHFKPKVSNHPKVLPNSVLFIGAATDYPKGFHVVRSLVENTDYNFCLVMKDNFSWDHPRVKVFNNVNHTELVDIINSCSVSICTSVHETQHLAGLECGACNLPIVATNVGCYYELDSGLWGEKAGTLAEFMSGIEKVMKNNQTYSSRSHFSDYDKEVVRTKWREAIESIL